MRVRKRVRRRVRSNTGARSRVSSSIKPPGVGEPVFHQTYMLHEAVGSCSSTLAQQRGWSHGGSHGGSQRGYHLYCD